jgi:hypothetical protein
MLRHQKPLFIWFATKEHKEHRVGRKLPPPGGGKNAIFGYNRLYLPIFGCIEEDGEPRRKEDVRCPARTPDTVTRMVAFPKASCEWRVGLVIISFLVGSLSFSPGFPLFLRFFFTAETPRRRGAAQPKSTVDLGVIPLTTLRAAPVDQYLRQL